MRKVLQRIKFVSCQESGLLWLPPLQHCRDEDCYYWY